MSCMPMTDEQHKVVKRVAERITQHPRTHRQKQWYQDGEFHENPLWMAVYEEPSPELLIDVEAMMHCGATACAAGHMILAALELGVPFDLVPIPPIPERTILDTAAHLAGMSAQQAYHLFNEPSEGGVRKAVSTAAESGDWSHLPDWDPQP